MAHSKLRLPTHFLKHYPKPNAWLRREVLPAKAYDFFQALCQTMNLRNEYHPALSLRESYKTLMGHDCDQTARKTEALLKKAGAIRLSKSNSEIWQICPIFCTKTKFLAGAILEGWCNAIPYTQDFEDYWARVTKDKQRNFRYAPLDDDPLEGEGEDYMLLKQEVEKSRMEISDLKQEIQMFRKESREIMMEMLGKLRKYEPAEVEKIERHLRLVKEDD